MKKLFPVFAFCLLPFALFADLSAVVTPGYQFPLDGTVAPTYQLLNELAEPTIAIYGTIGGSNTIAPGTITAVSLSGSVVDNATIGFNGNSPPNMQVLAAGIYGPGLIPASVTNLELFVDPNYFLLATNSIASTNSTTGGATNWLTLQPDSLTDTNISLSAAIAPGKLAGTTNGNYFLGGTNNNTPQFVMLPTNTFTLMLQTNAAGTTNLTLGLNTFVFAGSTWNWYESTVGTVLNTPHHLGYPPAMVRWTFRCETANNGYTVGDEIDLHSLRSTGGSGSQFITGSNETNVFLVQLSNSSPQFFNKTTGVSESLNSFDADWSLRCYAR